MWVISARLRFRNRRTRDGVYFVWVGKGPDLRCLDQKAEGKLARFTHGTEVACINTHRPIGQNKVLTDSHSSGVIVDGGA
jgi:hypothetical protein